MKRDRKAAICLAIGLVSSASVFAGDVALAKNPYALVVDRNVFGLNPPPPPVAAITTPAPSVKITATGIMSIFGQLQVIFTTTGGSKPADQSYMLAEGEAQDDIEVEKIDAKQNIITFKNHGQEEEVKLAGAGNSSGNQPTPTTTPVTMASGPIPGLTPNPQVTPAVPSKTGSSAVFFPTANINAGNTIKAGSTTATRTNTPTKAQQQPSIDPDVQQVMIVANHLKAIQDGDSTAKIFPSTDLDEDAGVPSNIAPSTNTPAAP